MKVEGSIFIDKEGIVFSKVKGDAQSTIRRFYNMLLEAKDFKDKLYYVYSDEWREFWLKSQNPSDEYWQGAGQIASQLLFSYNNFVFQPFQIGKSELFNEKPLPRTHGGLEYEGCPSSEYIYDKPSIDAWHDQWFINNSDRIDWTNTNGIMPRRDRVIEILRKELLALQNNIASDGSNNLGLPHPKFLRLKNTNWKTSNDDAIVSEHNEIIIRHQGEKIKAYSEKIGSQICTDNYYHCETELSDLEKDHGNKKVSMIYSIKKDDKYQFISIDTAHGKFELCGDDGTHICEIRFDGSPNGDDTQAADHSLKCVAEWKKNYIKK